MVITTTDKYGRKITSLRISITPICNLNCFYCHREGHKYNQNRFMTPSEIYKIVEVSTKFGVRKIKISGGEPLLRNDIVDIVKFIHNIEGIKDISLTTNGILLKDYAEKLKENGLNRINVSLDTLNPKKYEEITNSNKLNKVLEGIEKSIDVGLTPVKINYLAMKKTMDDLENIMEYCKSVGAILQIIELMPLDETLKKEYVNIDDIEREIQKKSIKTIVRKQMQNRKKYILEDDLEVEFVRPVDNSEFCNHCTRLRLTYDGYLKPCLLRDDNLTDVLTPLRNGEDIKKYFLESIDKREPYYK